MKKRGFFSRVASRLFGGLKKARPAPRKQTQREPAPFTEPPHVTITSGAEIQAAGNYALAGYRLQGHETGGAHVHGWRDVEAGAPLPTVDEWIKVDLVTINLAPDSEEGFYRTANVLGGFDAPPTFDFYNIEGDDYTLDDLASEMALAYGFAVQ
jgi:hypothetical protein